jgi:hypothetical protein
MNEQQRIQGVWLAADTIQGVFVIDPIDYPEREMMKPKDFYSSLNSVSDNETIFSFFDGNDEETFDRIDTEYGIH